MSEPFSPSCFLHSNILANIIAHDSSQKKEPKKVYLIYNEAISVKKTCMFQQTDKQQLLTLTSINIFVAPFATKRCSIPIR